MTYLRLLLEDPDAGARILVGAVHELPDGHWRVWLSLDGPAWTLDLPGPPGGGEAVDALRTVAAGAGRVRARAALTSQSRPGPDRTPT